MGLTLARLGLRPRVLLGVDALASGADEILWLREAGADLCLVPLDEGPVFTNHDTSAGRVQTCRSAGVPLTTGVIPRDWLGATAWCLAPVADEIDDSWSDVPSRDALVAIGWQGFLRTLVRGATVVRRAPRPSPLLKRAGLVVLSREDVGPDLSDDALLHLLRPPVTLAITAGSRGGLTVSVNDNDRRKVRRYPALEAHATVDPTGAGDAFLAGLLAARLGHPLAGSGRRGSAVRLAAALGSLVVEGPGLQGVPTLAMVAARLLRSETTRPARDEPADSLN